MTPRSTRKALNRGCVAISIRMFHVKRGASARRYAEGILRSRGGRCRREPSDALRPLKRTVVRHGAAPARARGRWRAGSGEESDPANSFAASKRPWADGSRRRTEVLRTLSRTPSGEHPRPRRGVEPAREPEPRA